MWLPGPWVGTPSVPFQRLIQVAGEVGSWGIPRIGCVHGLGLPPKSALNSYWPDADHAKGAPTIQQFFQQEYRWIWGKLERVHSGAFSKIVVFPTKFCIRVWLVVCSKSPRCTHHGIEVSNTCPHLPSSVIGIWSQHAWVGRNAQLSRLWPRVNLGMVQRWGWNNIDVALPTQSLRLSEWKWLWSSGILTYSLDRCPEKDNDLPKVTQQR